MASKIGKLNISRTILLLCDMQEKFAAHILNFNHVVGASGRLTEVAKLLSVPAIITEQHPKGLGRTVPDLLNRLDKPTIIEKTQFSMCTSDLMAHINKTIPNYESILLCGIEAHACVLGTCLDFLEAGKDVHVIVDAVASRSLVDRKYAFSRMLQSGAFLTTSEAVMFLLCKNANHPKFKEVQKLIRNPTPESDILKM